MSERNSAVAIYKHEKAERTYMDFECRRTYKRRRSISIYEFVFRFPCYLTILKIKTVTGMSLSWLKFIEHSMSLLDCVVLDETACEMSV